jgi:dienelactone hydrolase
LAGDPMYHHGHELCRRGYVVLCPDLLCFEERQPTRAGRAARRLLAGADSERFEFTKRLLTGSCLQTKYLHDLTCAVDLLASLPSVNRERLGVIGHSLGGLQALWLTWYGTGRVRPQDDDIGVGYNSHAGIPADGADSTRNPGTVGSERHDGDDGVRI